MYSVFLLVLILKMLYTYINIYKKNFQLLTPTSDIKNTHLLGLSFNLNLQKRYFSSKINNSSTDISNDIDPNIILSDNDPNIVLDNRKLIGDVLKTNFLSDFSP